MFVTSKLNLVMKKMIDELILKGAMLQQKSKHVFVVQKQLVVEYMNIQIQKTKQRDFTPFRHSTDSKAKVAANKKSASKPPDVTMITLAGEDDMEGKNNDCNGKVMPVLDDQDWIA